MKEETLPYTQMIRDKILKEAEKVGFTLELQNISADFQAGFKAGKGEILKVIKDMKL
jgi:uncharacterized protein Yka (UPF0111/DUF47 family)